MPLQRTGLVTIRLSRELVAVVNESDEPILSAHKWYAKPDGNTFYAVTRVNGKTTYMHRLLLGSAVATFVDHKDGNGLNNARSNLRECTKAENSRNASKRRDGSSPYKGVSWYRWTGRWVARIQVDNKAKHLGYFSSAELAAMAYDIAARDLFGDFAKVNFAVAK